MPLMISLQLYQKWIIGNDTNELSKEARDLNQKRVRLWSLDSGWITIEKSFECKVWKW